MYWRAILWAVLVSAPISAQAQTRGAADEALQRLVSGDCKRVLEPLNRGLHDRQAKAFYVAGLMFARGLCVAADVPRGIQHLEIAAKGGDHQAAEELVVIHGLGRGVAQDYARAGVWAVAMSDILRAQNKQEAPNDDSGQAGRTDPSTDKIDANWAKACAQVVLIHALAAERIRGSRVRVDGGGSVLVKVVVSSAGPGSQPTYLVEDVVQDRSVRTGSHINKPIGESTLRDLQAIFEGAIRDAPALPDNPAVVYSRREILVTAR